MMKSPNLRIVVLSLKCNYEDGRSFCQQIKSHIGWKDEVKTKQVITFSRPQTNWGGRVLSGLEPIHNIGPSPGLYSSRKNQLFLLHKVHLDFLWAHNISSLYICTYFFLVHFEASWSSRKIEQIVTKQPLLLSVCTSTNLAALPSILKYPRIWGSWNPKSLDSISQSCSGLAM